MLEFSIVKQLCSQNGPYPHTTRTSMADNSQELASSAPSISEEGGQQLEKQEVKVSR
jgi:hypothetical protein